MFIHRAYMCWMKLDVELRLYKRFDADLLALQSNGISVRTLAINAVVSYANNRPYKVYLPETRPHDMNGQQKYHSRITFTDPAAVELLKSIKHGFRNAFCKTLLRDALVHQNLGAFFASDELITKENVRIAQIPHDDTEVCNFNTKIKKLKTKDIFQKEAKEVHTESKIESSPVLQSLPNEQLIPEEPTNNESAATLAEAPIEPVNESEEDAERADSLMAMFESMM